MMLLKIYYFENNYMREIFRHLMALVNHIVVKILKSLENYIKLSIKSNIFNWRYLVN